MSTRPGVGRGVTSLLDYASSGNTPTDPFPPGNGSRFWGLVVALSVLVIAVALGADRGVTPLRD